MRVTIDDGELDVLDDGAGVAVVMLHGFPLSKETWDAQAALLTSSARVVRIDLRGLGASRGGPGPYLMESLASDVAAVLDALGIERAVIVGHSLGTYVAYAFFRMFEERVLGLGLVSGRADADSPETAARRFAVAERIERDGMEPAAADWVRQFFAPAVYRERPELVALARRIVLATNADGAAAVLRGMALRVAADDLFAHIAVPVLLVSGRFDTFATLDHQHAVGAAIRGARVVALETGHVPLLEAPEALAAQLARLVAEARVTSAGGPVDQR